MTTARPGNDGRAVVLGRIGAPFGVQGWVKVKSYTDPPEGIASYSSWDLVRAGHAERRAVLDWKRAGRAVAVRLEGVESRDAAQALTGCDVRVERSELPPTAPGEYYWHDLIGSRGLDAAAASRSGGSTGCWSCRPIRCWCCAGERERLVPLVPERLVSVDLEAGRLTLDWHPDD